MNGKNNSRNRDLINPYDMEERGRYVDRFQSHNAMKELFGESTQCQEIANQIWKDRMNDASVTVRMLDGREFFID